MINTSCENCLWSDQCSEEQGCDNFTPIDEDEYLEDIRTKIEYEYEWRNYLHHWRGNDKWGDLDE